MMLLFFFGIGVSLALVRADFIADRTCRRPDPGRRFAATHHPVGLAMLAMDSSNCWRTRRQRAFHGNFGIAFAADIGRSDLADQLARRFHRSRSAFHCVGPGVACECIETKDGPVIWEDHFYPEINQPRHRRSAARWRVGRIGVHLAD